MAFQAARSAILALCSTALTGGALAEVRDGVYSDGKCQSQAATDKVVISGSDLTYLGLSCQLTEPKTIEDFPGPTLYAVVCEAGGSTTRERLMLMNGGFGGLVVIAPGFAQNFASCEVEESLDALELE